MQHRKTLSRQLGELGPHYLFIGVNPSTADASTDDQTIRKLIGFSKRWGCSSFEVANLFTERATDIKNLTGGNLPRANSHLIHAADTADKVVCMWGSRKKSKLITPRVEEVWSFLAHHELWCFKLTALGDPYHPLTLPYTTKLKRYYGAA